MVINSFTLDQLVTVKTILSSVEHLVAILLPRDPLAALASSTDYLSAVNNSHIITQLISNLKILQLGEERGLQISDRDLIAEIGNVEIPRTEKHVDDLHYSDDYDDDDYDDDDEYYSDVDYDYDDDEHADDNMMIRIIKIVVVIEIVIESREDVVDESREEVEVEGMVRTRVTFNRDSRYQVHDPLLAQSHSWSQSSLSLLSVSG
jgi:hypothetical protein